MDQLNRLIQDASNQFTCHNFQTALTLYTRCIKKCEDEQLPTYILHNLKTTEAAICAIFGDYEIALTTLNQVLEKEPQHWLALLRRSQVYKKQEKYKRAMKDLDKLSLYAPDNMQVAAFKQQLKVLMVKPLGSSSEQSSMEQEDIDEQEMLRFSNLKKIDRTSVSIVLPKHRQSRVTLCGDQTVVYEADQNEPSQQQQQQEKEQIRHSSLGRSSKDFTPQFIKLKAMEVDEELQKQQEEENDDQIQEMSPQIRVSCQPNLKLSILKKKQSEIFVNEDVSPVKRSIFTSNNGSRLAEKVQDIDGKIISSQKQIRESAVRGSIHEVQFMKSVNLLQLGQSKSNKPQHTVEEQLSEPPRLRQTTSRKSCLKNSVFDIDPKLYESNKGPRMSLYDSMTRNSIDGKFIRSSKRKEQGSQASKQNVEDAHQNGSDTGSIHNIFGGESNKLQIPPEIRASLGLSQNNLGLSQSPQGIKRQQSILKKGSFLFQSQRSQRGSALKEEAFLEERQQPKESSAQEMKKSVIFKKQ